MRLLAPADVPEGAVRRTFRYGVLGHLLAAGVLCAVPAVVGRLAWRGARELGGLELLVFVPVALLVGGLWLLILAAVVGATRGALSRAGWVMKVAGDGLWLNLRSYQNLHLDGEPPIVHLAFSEIASAGRLTEWRTEPRGDERRTTIARFLELRLAGADTASLRAAVAAERAREGPERSFLGIRHSGRSHHVPVLVPEPGVVLVDWRGGGVLRALEGRVPIVPPRRVTRGDEADATRPDDRVRELEGVQRERTGAGRA